VDPAIGPAEAPVTVAAAARGAVPAATALTGAAGTAFRPTALDFADAGTGRLVTNSVAAASAIAGAGHCASSCLTKRDQVARKFMSGGRSLKLEIIVEAIVSRRPWPSGLVGR
jgi:hypothetical protein